MLPFISLPMLSMITGTAKFQVHQVTFAHKLLTLVSQLMKTAGLGSHVLHPLYRQSIGYILVTTGLHSRY